MQTKINKQKNWIIILIKRIKFQMKIFWNMINVTHLLACLIKNFFILNSI